MDQIEEQPRSGTLGALRVAPGGVPGLPPGGDVHRHSFTLDKRLRGDHLGQRPFAVWFTGLSGAGKSTIADLVERRLYAEGRHTFLLDGDDVRHGLNSDLGFSDEARSENIRRVAEAARLMVEAGLIVLVALISPFRAERERARSLFEPGEFVEVYINTPLEVAAARDPKGLYARARRGQLVDFTGIDSRYEAPCSPELELVTTRFTPAGASDRVISSLRERGLLGPRRAETIAAGTGLSRRAKGRG